MESTKKNFYKSKYFHIVICVLLAATAALILLPFGRSERQSGHDIRYHLNVIRSLSAAWENGKFFNKLMELIGGDYGYGTGLFYSTLPAGICVFFMQVFHLPIMGALYLEMLLLFAVATVVVYFFLYRVFDGKILAAIGAGVYLIYPYFLWNLYVRFAYTEIFLMLAIPLIVWGIYELLYRQNPRAFLPLFICGYILAIFSHMTMTVYLTLFIGIWLLVDYKRTFKKKNLLYFGIAAAVVLLITASYYLPMLVNYGVTATDTMSKTPEQMDKNTKKYFTEQILMWDYKFVVAATLLYALWYRCCAKGKRTTGKKAIVICSLLTVSLFTHYFPWDRMPNFLRMIQYTFRILLLGGILTSLQTCILVKEVFFTLPATWKSCKLSAVAIDKEEEKEEENAAKGEKQGAKDASCDTSWFARFTRKHKIFRWKNIVKFIPSLVLSLGIVFCGAMAIPHNKAMFDSYNNASQHADVALDDLTGRSEFYGLGAGKHGDYFPLNCRWEHVSTRVKQDLIWDTNMQVTEVADYRALKQVSFIVQKTKDAYAVLDVPYTAFEGVELYRFRTTSSNQSLEITAKSYDGGNKVYLKTANDGNESKIILSYRNAPAFEAYLSKTAFGVLTLEGDALASNLKKEYAGKYSLEVDAGQNGGVLELPSYYYKGYKLTLITKDGRRVALSPIHGRNGFLEAEINESGVLYVEFSAPYLTAAKVLSWVGVTLFCGVLVWCVFYKNRKERAEGKILSNGGEIKE